jgi:hypothetical protein
MRVPHELLAPPYIYIMAQVTMTFLMAFRFFWNPSS